MTVRNACGSSCVFNNDTLVITVTFIIYLGALLAFVGWFLFAIYVGIGFVGLPIDMFKCVVGSVRSYQCAVRAIGVCLVRLLLLLQLAWLACVYAVLCTMSCVFRLEVARAVCSGLDGCGVCCSPHSQLCS